jgi:hypothetical protein
LSGEDKAIVFGSSPVMTGLPELVSATAILKEFRTIMTERIARRAIQACGLTQHELNIYPPNRTDRRFEIRYASIKAYAGYIKIGIVITMQINGRHPVDWQSPPVAKNNVDKCNDVTRIIDMLFAIGKSP